MLARYATRFPVVEVNSSFYRPHQGKTYARWAASVPPHFRFSVKIPRTISHELALRGTGSTLDRFLGEAGELDEKLGGFLLQLPPSLALDMRTASSFFRVFRARSAAPLVVEPRHASWFDEKVEPMFDRFEVSRVAADPARVEAADRPNPGAVWPYWRQHGSPRMYYSNYPEQALRTLAHEVASYARGPIAPWVIFDNTAHDFAIANAARLQELLAAPARSRKRARA
jgi:uncharacterized protein YecE (DUF72 family)